VIKIPKISRTLVFQTMKITEPTGKITLPYVDIEFYAPDLVIYHYHPKINLTWEMLQEIASVTNPMIGFRPCYMCSVIGQGLTVDKEAREKGPDPEIQKYTKAGAIVQNSLAHRILANFIIRVQRPPVPTRSFSSIQDALTWFKKMREVELKSKRELVEND
jgi:hypothetical protein